MKICRAPVYVDESLHDRADFIVTALLTFPEPLDELVDNALRLAGLRPGIDEFKSSATMRSAPALRTLRSTLSSIVQRSGARLGLVVCHRSERGNLVEHATRLLEAMLKRGRFDTAGIDVFLDQGMRIGPAADIWKTSPTLAASRLIPNQDSRKIRGLQLADLCAHVTSTILLSDLGFVRKVTRAGEGSGFDPDELIDLDFALWAGLRYCLASGERSWPDEDRSPTAFADYDAHGLFVSDLCTPAVRQAALDRFAQVFMGCIH